MEIGPRVVTHIHGGEHGELEKPHPELVHAGQHPRVGAHQQSEGFAVAEFIVAPFAEPFEDRVDAQFGMGFELAVDGDVAGVADLFRQIGRVENEFRLEEMVFFRPCEKAEVDAGIEVAQRLVDEAGVAGFIAAHVAEQAAKIFVAAAFLDFGVEHAAGEFGGDRADQEIEKLAAERFGHAGDVDLEFIGAGEVTLVGVGLQLGHQGFPLIADRADVDLVEGGEIGGVEARAQHGAVLRGFGLGVRRAVGAGCCDRAGHGVHDLRLRYGSGRC